jgi:flagellar hook-associated protein 3 FlgL
MISLSTAAFYQRATGQMGSLRAQADDLQRQIGTEQRLSRSSDDPVAAARLRTLARSERLAEIDQRNSDQARNDLRMTDDALGSIANAIIQAQTLAMKATTGTLNGEQRAAVGQEIAALRQTLLDIANGRDSAGHALFGGQSAGAAYEDTGAGIIYIGTASANPVDLGVGQSVTPALTGPEVFGIEAGGVDSDLFAVLGALAAALQSGGDVTAAAQDALAGLEAGLGKVATAQTVVGGRLGWIEVMDQHRENTAVLVTEEKAVVGGVDLATTMARLQEVMTVLEASQASFVRLADLSLFNMLR